MKDFSELKDKVLSTIGKAADAGKDVASKAAEKAKAGTRIAKLSIEIANEKENMKKTYIEIGKLYYDMHKDEPEGFFIQLCDEITLAAESIAAKEAEIEELRTQENEEECCDADITVEFEEVVSEDEAACEEAAEPSCCDEGCENGEEEAPEE